MKFGKRLKQQIQETLPEWRDKFLSYKELKQLVRMISLGSGSGSDPTLLNGSSSSLTTSSSQDVESYNGKAEADFVYLLNNEIDKFNAFFMEMEEDFIIRHKELQQRIQRVQETWGPNGSFPSEMEYKEEMGKIRKDIVNFHGEMVLLINYSNINYTGLAKILKKYDKRTGGLLRLPFIQKVLEQPFFTTDLISKLIKDLEATIDAVFPAGVDDQQQANGGEETTKRSSRKNNEIKIMGEGIFRNTLAALLTIQEIRRGSSTYSHFSLPPLSLPDSELIQSIQVSSPIPIL